MKAVALQRVHPVRQNLFMKTNVCPNIYRCFNSFNWSCIIFSREFRASIASPNAYNNKPMPTIKVSSILAIISNITSPRLIGLLFIKNAIFSQTPYKITMANSNTVSHFLNSSFAYILERGFKFDHAIRITNMPLTNAPNVCRYCMCAGYKFCRLLYF